VAERLAEQANRRADEHATARKDLEGRQASIARGIDACTRHLTEATAARDQLARLISDAHALGDAAHLLSLPADSQDRLATLERTVLDLTTEHTRLQERRTTLDVEIGDLTQQEAACRQRAKDAVTTALQGEHDAQLAEIDAARVRYLHRAHRLAGLSALDLKLASVKPILKDDVNYGVGFIDSFLNMVGEVDHIHHALDSQYRQHGLSVEPR
jgi:chromosome segregation ATPase